MSLLARLKAHAADVLIVVAALIASSSVVVYYSAKFTERTFGRLPLQQILFNVRTNGGDDAQNAIIREYVWQIAGYSLKAAGVIALIAFLAWLVLSRHSFLDTLHLLWRCTLRIIRFFNFRCCIVLLLLWSSYYFLHTVDRKFHVVKFLKQEDCPFIENNYATPNTNHINHLNGQKRNLIVISLESMEAGYSNEAVFGENLIPELDALTKEGMTLSGYRRTPGSYFTLDGISCRATQ